MGDDVGWNEWGDGEVCFLCRHIYTNTHVDRLGGFGMMATGVGGSHLDVF